MVITNHLNILYFNFGKYNASKIFKDIRKHTVYNFIVDTDMINSPLLRTFLTQQEKEYTFVALDKTKLFNARNQTYASTFFSFGFPIKRLRINVHI